MKHHHVRGPEETVCDLPPVVPAGPASRSPPICLREAACQASRRQKTQAGWLRRNPGYAISWRIDQRAAQTQPPPEPLRLPAPLNQLPWDVAKDQLLSSVSSGA